MQSWLQRTLALTGVSPSKTLLGIPVAVTPSEASVFPVEELAST
ncbi:hypothetical protein PR003_g23363 [Phytophthora rubi]|uniref:Uncharacterized protein n=1 Tax=Phytophthora rubi TaxID=129364 RepID=A0A6A3IZT5_9STRA|nr:hypothetical protein PR001_g22324 [Phytophthora rubi]KAE9297971.1 hypothetical protein PR003_g23363 [Phytophthora rubi]